MSNFQNFNNQNITLIGKNCSIQGDLTLSGIVRLASVIQGNIIVSPYGEMTIEREGALKGNIRCFDIEIFGQFEGKIVSEGKVTFHPSARVEGSVWAERIIIYPGAKANIEGHTLEKTLLPFHQLDLPPGLKIQYQSPHSP